MNIYFTFAIWIAMGAATAYFARQRGRDPIIWFIVGLLFGFLGCIALFLFPSHAEKKEPVTSLPPALPVQVLPFAYRKKEWFYLTPAGEQVGPMSFELLQQNWAEGQILEQAYVWCDGMEQWLTINEIQSQVPGFFE